MSTAQGKAARFKCSKKLELSHCVVLSASGLVRQNRHVVSVRSFFLNCHAVSVRSFFLSCHAVSVRSFFVSRHTVSVRCFFLSCHAVSVRCFFLSCHAVSVRSFFLNCHAVSVRSFFLNCHVVSIRSFFFHYFSNTLQANSRCSNQQNSVTHSCQYNGMDASVRELSLIHI